MPVTIASVRAILVQPASDEVITNGMETAALIATESLAGKGLTDARIEVISKWLAAHYSSLFVVKSEAIENNSTSYAVDVGQGLMATRYGQEAVRLDTSGTLKNLDKNAELKTAFFEVY